MISKSFQFNHFSCSLLFPFLLFLYFFYFIFSFVIGGSKADSLYSTLISIWFSSSAAFAISYSTAWSARVASSTSYSMVGALNKLPVAVSGMLFFNSERKVANLGYVLSIIIGIYNLFYPFLSLLSS